MKNTFTAGDLRRFGDFTKRLSSPKRAVRIKARSSELAAWQAGFEKVVLDEMYRRLEAQSKKRF